MGIEEIKEETYGSIIDKCKNNLYNYINTGEQEEIIFLNDRASILLLTMTIIEDSKFDDKLSELLMNDDYLNSPDEYKPTILALNLTKILKDSGCYTNINTIDPLIKNYLINYGFGYIN